MRPINPTRESLGLKEGEIYTFTFLEAVDGGKRQQIKKRMRLIKCYRHHAVFEGAKGVRRSFRYWDIDKLLHGQER